MIRHIEQTYERMRGIVLRGQKAKRPQGLVCQFCQFSELATTRRAPFVRQYASASPLHRNDHLGQLRMKKGLKASQVSSQLISKRFESSTPQTTSAVDPETALRHVEKEASVLRNSDSVPADKTVVQLLKKCQAIAEVLVSRDQDHQRETSSATREDENAISSLLDLEEKNTARKLPKSPDKAQTPLIDSVSQIANDILKDDKVFISPDALACYTNIQTLLQKADHFPEIFTYTRTNPSRRKIPPPSNTAGRIPTVSTAPSPPNKPTRPSISQSSNETSPSS